ncbi:hypothetical protein COHA_009288 [Chlorella ohadii]|uniref:Uncharacterized protein n=1 Tax=Chlorella ohadii TaxID=2649997 RepID=A0AAD5DF20_9CHLO|nr:hypothetical protein COHA_009288 [Chlorella ohadii]
MYVPRPSILHRPHREGGKANQETAEAVAAREEARLAAKAARQQGHEERMLAAFYGTQEDKRRAWEHAQREAAELAAARSATLRAEEERTAAWTTVPQRVVVDMERPWTAASSTYYMPPEVEAEARRRAQREAAEVNRQQAQGRAAVEAAQRAAEQDALRRTMAAEDTYFNRGAASERWIPPERRIKQRAAVPAQFAPGPPPYCMDSELPSSSSRSSSGCPSPSSSVATQRRPASASRRALEGAGVAAALRHYAAPLSGGGGSFSYGVAPGGGAPAGGMQRPSTAPAQRQYPWSWQT